MIIKEIKNIKSGKKELRKFGITIGIFLGLLGMLFWWRAIGYYCCFFIISITFLFFGLALPILLKPIHKVWMTLSIFMGWVSTGIILSVLFYIVVAPIGLLTSLFSNSFLDLKFSSNSDTYWILRKETEKDRSDYEKQF